MQQRRKDTGEVSGPGTGVSGGRFASHAGGVPDTDTTLQTAPPSVSSSVSPSRRLVPRLMRRNELRPGMDVWDEGGDVYEGVLLHTTTDGYVVVNPSTGARDSVWTGPGGLVLASEQEPIRALNRDTVFVETTNQWGEPVRRSHDGCGTPRLRDGRALFHPDAEVTVPAHAAVDGDGTSLVLDGTDAFAWCGDDSAWDDGFVETHLDDNGVLRQRIFTADPSDGHQYRCARERVVGTDGTSRETSWSRVSVSGRLDGFEWWCRQDGGREQRCDPPVQPSLWPRIRDRQT